MFNCMVFVHRLTSIPSWNVFKQETFRNKFLIISRKLFNFKPSKQNDITSSRKFYLFFRLSSTKMIIMEKLAISIHVEMWNELFSSSY